MNSFNEVLALVNDVLQSVIVIFGVSVTLYNLRYIRRDRIVRAFTLLLAAVSLVYMSELLASRTFIEEAAENWLKAKWLGITLVPAIQFHLSDALLIATGYTTRRRRWITTIIYATSFIFLGLVWFTSLIVTDPVRLPNATHFSAGNFFFLFTIYYFFITLTSIYNVWRAYLRCLTLTTRRRMRYILFAIIAAPVSVYPYLTLLGSGISTVPTLLWLVLIIGNLLIGWLFSILTANILYLGSVSPDRVARVKLFKFMARVPLAASVVLLVYALAIRTPRLLGVNSIAATGMMIVGTVILVEWAIHTAKNPLERLLQFNNEPDVRRIHELGQRLLTPQDLRQLLENLLAVGCNALQIPSAFVATITAEAAQLEVLIGAIDRIGQVWDQAQLESLPTAEELLERDGDHLRWHNYWVEPLYDRDHGTLLGILGLEVRDNWEPDSAESLVFEKLVAQAATALEDRLLQQQVFAAVEGALPSIIALQRQRQITSFGGEKPSIAPVNEAVSDSAESDPLLHNPDFSRMVRDALTHYWGGPKLTESPLLNLAIVRKAAEQYGDNPVKALRAILKEAIERQKPPENDRDLTQTEWLLYNILEMKFVQGSKVRDVALHLAMSESDLYRKQRVAIENVARAIGEMEQYNSAEGTPNIDLSKRAIAPIQNEDGNPKNDAIPSKGNE